MTIYTVSIGNGNEMEASKEFFKLSVKSVVEFLKDLQKKAGKGDFKAKAGKFYKNIELSEKWLEDALKEDTAHIGFGPKGKLVFWANINTAEAD